MVKEKNEPEKFARTSRRKQEGYGARYAHIQQHAIMRMQKTVYVLLIIFITLQI